MISFVVPAHNEEQHLGATLAALRLAAEGIGRGYELIVVDDASSDRTADIARAAGARVVAVDFRQIARARNAGARAATGSVLIFVDADTLVSGATLRATLDAIDRGAVGGGAVVRFDGPLSLGVRLFAVVLRVSMRLGHLAAGAYLFCTRHAFDAVGGFDERLFVTEELVLSRALRRVGPTTILRAAVTTSGRKVRTHPGWELIRPLAALVRYGPRVLRSRDQLDLWYGQRRADPHRGRSSGAPG